MGLGSGPEVTEEAVTTQAQQLRKGDELGRGTKEVDGWLATIAQKWAVSLTASMRRLECSVVERAGYDSDPEVVEIYIPASEFEESRDEHEDGQVLESAASAPRRGYDREPPIEELGRIGQNVYEVVQVQPARSMQRDVLVKNDGGSQLTFVDPVLFAYGVKSGFVTNVRKFRLEDMLGIGGTSVVDTMGDMMVCFEGSLVKVKLQVILNAAIADRNYQVLLGTDNLLHLGARVDLEKGYTEYSRVPGVTQTLQSMHLAPASATRVFNARRVCADSVESPEYLSPRWNSGARLDKELADIQEQSGTRSRFLDEREESEMIDGLATEDTALLKLLVDSVERCVQSGDKRQHREACKMLGISEKSDRQHERELMARMAKAHRRFYGDSSEKATAAGDSFTFEYDEDTKAVKPVDSGMEKVAKDRAGHGWRKWTREELIAHIIDSSELLVDDRYISKEWVDSLLQTAQPPTDKLPAVKNHYYYVKLKPGAVPWKAKYVSTPRNLMGRLREIIESMEKMDIIEKTDSAEFTCPITLVMGKDKDGNSTISRICCDARSMNENLIVEPEAVPNMHEVMMHAEGGYVYSTTDLVKSFWETKIAPNSTRFCAFRCAIGCYLWKRKFFGVRNGSTQQMKLMLEIIGDDLYGEWDGITCYVDDCALYSKRKPGESEESVMRRHADLVSRFTLRLCERGVTLNIEKSSFFQKSIDFLGYNLGRDGVSIQEQKRSTIVNTPHPKTASELHTFIGGIVWLSKALAANTAQLLAPLRKYVVQRQTDRTYVNPYKPDDPEVVQAVELLKQKVADAATLISPRWSWMFHLYCDGAQSKGVGGLMAHWIDTGRPGEKPLVGELLEELQKECELTGDPLAPVGWEELSEEAREQFRAVRRGAQAKEEAKVKYTQLDIASGLHVPNRRLPSEQREPQAPICAHTGLRRVGYFAPIAFHSKSLQKQQARWTSREVEVFAIITMLRRWESYLLGSRLTIHTDCKCLEYLAKYQDTWGKLGRWCSYMSMFKYELVWCAGCENGCADWLSRAPLLDTYCPDDGELPKEKYCVDEAGNLQFIDSAERATKEGSSERRRRLEVASAESVGDRASRKPTVYSVCAGIGSCMQAIERFNISAKMIGCCEINDEISAELGAAFPHVPNHGDMRTVIAAMESGELELHPDIVIFTVPCQSRSRARLLTEWYGKEHPHHHLWDLQARFIELAKPAMVLIENVPPRSWGENPTEAMYHELASKIRSMGYSYTAEEDLNCAELGANTSRRRYFGVGVKGDTPFVFPKRCTKYKGFRDLLDPAYSVRHNYRCRLSATESWKPVRLQGPYTSPFRSKQIGKVVPESVKEQELAERMGMLNPKGFRIYSSKSPAPTICAYGSEKYCGPGRHAQFITDKVGVRTFRLVEAARIMGFVPRVVDQLSTVKESLAFHMVGNAVPVETLGAIIGAMVEMWRCGFVGVWGQVSPVVLRSWRQKWRAFA